MNTINQNWLSTLTPYMGYYVHDTYNEDIQRLEAITPYFEHYKVQDLLPLVKDHLLKIRIRRQIQHLSDNYDMDDYTIIFTDTISKSCFDDKIIISILVNFMNICNKIITIFHKENRTGFRDFSRGVFRIEINSETLSVCADFDKMKCTESIKLNN